MVPLNTVSARLEEVQSKQNPVTLTRYYYYMSAKPKKKDSVAQLVLIVSLIYHQPERNTMSEWYYVQHKPHIFVV